MKILTRKNIAAASILVLCLIIAIFFINAYANGKFTSVKTLQEYVSGFGIFAPLILTVIQAIQVIIPVLPGFLGCAVGAVLFGSFGGFLCNYIGISAGSIIAFFLARKYGIKLVQKMFSKEKYDKWSGWLENKKSYTVMLFLGILLPLFPDDFFCYFTGLTKMTSKKFIWIIIAAKPWCILLYSLMFGVIS